MVEEYRVEVVRFRPLEAPSPPTPVNVRFCRPPVIGRPNPTVRTQPKDIKPPIKAAHLKAYMCSPEAMNDGFQLDAIETMKING